MKFVIKLNGKEEKYFAYLVDFAFFSPDINQAQKFDTVEAARSYMTYLSKTCVKETMHVVGFL